MAAITHPDAIELVRLSVLKHALRLEMKGLKHSSRRSVYAAVKREFGFRGNKKKVLEQLEKLIEEKEVAHGISPGTP